MKFFYGIENNYTDISDLVYKYCKKNNHIIIPSSDHNRAMLFGDPLFGILKNIKVEFDDNTFKIFDHIQQIVIQIDNNLIIEKPEPKILTRTEWWETIGKNIDDSRLKLYELHKYLNIQFGNKFDEYPEQLMAINFIKENDIVLELGGNIGRNTCVIAQLLKDDKNLVSLECNPKHVKELTINRNNNNFNFQIEPSALSKRNLIQKGWDTKVSDIVLPGYFKVNTISWDDLKNKYNLNFNTLVADCEGALYYILQDEPDMLKDFDKVIMENDYWDINHKNFVDENLKKNGFKVVFSGGGGWGPCSSFFYEVWKK